MAVCFVTQLKHLIFCDAKSIPVVFIVFVPSESTYSMAQH